MKNKLLIFPLLALLGYIALCCSLQSKVPVLAQEAVVETKVQKKKHSVHNAETIEKGGLPVAYPWSMGAIILIIGGGLVWKFKAKKKKTTITKLEEEIEEQRDEKVMENTQNEAIEDHKERIKKVWELLIKGMEINEQEEMIERLQNRGTKDGKGFSIQSKFPSTAKIMENYNSLDTQRANVKEKIKEMLKDKKSVNKNHKRYFEQCLHEWLFELLIESEKQVQEFMEKIFSDIDTKIREIRKNEPEHESDEDNEEKKNDTSSEDEPTQSSREETIKKKDIFGNMLKPYLQKNHTLFMKEYIHDLLTKVKENKKRVDYFGSLPFKSCEEEEIKKLDEYKEALDEYIEKCLTICWTMVLNIPEIKISPKKFWAKDNEKLEGKFDQKTQKKKHGSDKNSNNILYIVWPILINNKGDLMSKEPMHVMVRDERVKSQVCLVRY